MMTQREKRLKLWKARQTAEGYDVSGVTTLEQAEHFFDKKEEPAAPAVPAPAEETESGESEEPAVPEEPEKPKKPKAKAQKKDKEV